MVCPSLPPGPKLPAAVQGAWLAYRPYQFLERCQREHGDAFTLTTPIGRIAVFARPDYAERIFRLDETSLLGGAAQAPLVNFAGDRSLMKLDGSEHGEHRKILAGSLRPSELPGGGAELLGRIRASVMGWPIGRRFDLGEALDRLAIELAADLCLGGLPEEFNREMARTIRRLRQSVTALGLVFAALRPQGPGPFERFRSLVEPYLRDRIARRDHDAPSLFRQLAERGIGALGVDGLLDETMTLYMATVGGLSSSMKHTFHRVMHEPEVGPRIRISTASLVARGDAKGVAADPFLDSVCKEVLRLCPDIPFAVRRALVDIEVGPWRLPEGTTMGVGIYLIQRRSESFPEPDRFLPDRFLNARPSRFEYLPFGGGRRGCVAASFFPFLQKLILAAACERLDLRPRGPKANPVTTLGLVSSLARPLLATAGPSKSARFSVEPGASVTPALHLPARKPGETCPSGHDRSRARRS